MNSQNTGVTLEEFFSSQEIKRAFRQDKLPAQKTVMFILSLILVVSNLVYVSSDFKFHAGTMLEAHIAVRCFMVLFTVALILIMRKTSSVSVFDTVVFSWLIINLASIIFIDFNRPHGGFSYLFADLICIIGIYIAAPISIIRKHIISLSLTVSTLIILFLGAKSYTGVELLAIISTLIVMNILGSFVSVNQEKSKRKDYMMGMREKQLREQLEKTLSEMKVLQGMLPICAWCKKIRINNLEWEQLETYLLKHTEAQFSHGICPECKEKQTQQAKEALKKRSG